MVQNELEFIGCSADIGNEAKLSINNMCEILDMEVKYFCLLCFFFRRLDTFHLDVYVLPLLCCTTIHIFTTPQRLNLFQIVLCRYELGLVGSGLIEIILNAKIKQFCTGHLASKLFVDVSTASRP